MSSSPTCPNLAALVSNMLAVKAADYIISLKNYINSDSVYITPYRSPKAAEGPSTSKTNYRQQKENTTCMTLSAQAAIKHSKLMKLVMQIF
ncbi:MAG: hypothetical protein ACJATQ_001252 [Cellvibrionaceae bacterium]|jgi:hypothetical protein